jgi:dihydrofolate synthase/folylpolyglutamate synthase
VPVITTTDEPEALKIIEEVAHRENAPLIKIAQASRLSAAETAALPLPGEHQKLNAALALATVEVLQNKIPVSKENIQAGLHSVNWPGRLQWVALPNSRRILLDGAHNVAGAKVLREALSSWSSSFSLSGCTLKCELQRAGSKTGAPLKFTLILGVLQDKDWRGICETLAPLASRILTVPVSSERSANPNQLATACCAANLSAEISVCDSLHGALEKIPDNNPIVITGSLYLVGEALELLGFSPAAGCERTLNEWRAAPAS